MTRLEMLLQEKQARTATNDKIVNLIKENYIISDPNIDYNRNFEKAGDVYQFLAISLGVFDTCQFKQRVKSILLKANLMKISKHANLVWFRGLKRKWNLPQ